MKIIVAYLGDVLHCPPAMSLINCLNNTHHDVVFLCYPDDSIDFLTFTNSNPKVRFVYIGPSNTRGRSLKKAWNFIGYRRRVKKLVVRESSGNSIIWVLSNGSLKYFGKYLVKMKYILHLLELTEKLYFIESKHWFPMSKKYYKRAAAIVECEYNRAHITKAWWQLSKMPFVLQNKPFNHVDRSRYDQAELPPEIFNLINVKLKDKKIILYQGNISKERPLDPFIEAVSDLGSDYAFVAMTNGAVSYTGESENFYQLPFVAPPRHLLVTKHAYIGVLSYVPIKNSYSILNTLYCAPNKIWEYSSFGVPMIGNDLPVLRSHFLEFQDGISLKTLDKERVKEAIMRISASYDLFSHNSRQFFESYNYQDCVNDILESVS